ncbi:signal peptidase I, partial [Deinococcus multiflagellatus]
MTRPDKPALSPLQKLWKEVLEPIVFAVVITQFVATLVGVDGVSMMPNLRDRERVFVPKYETWLHKAGIGEFKRGDILIFKPPREASAKIENLTKAAPLNLWTYRPFLIKRLIGLPGDKIRIQGGEVSVNGVKLDSGWTTDFWKAQGCWDTESPVANLAQSSRIGERGFMQSVNVVQDQEEFTVPAGHYYVMGDNRTATGSEDSRIVGPVPRRDVAGRAAAVVWPIMRKVNV